MSLPPGLCYRPMLGPDCARLARMLPALLPGNWSEAQLQGLLDGTHQCRVLCEQSGAATALVGFVEFTVVLDECELLAVAIAAGRQGRGLGRALLACLLDELRRQGCRICHLEVRRSNTAAIALYTGQGFRPSGLRKGYYPPRPGGVAAEDALLYSLIL